MQYHHHMTFGPVYYSQLILINDVRISENGEGTRLPLTPPASSTSSSSSSCSDSECSQSPKRHAPVSPHTVQQLFQQQSVNSLVSVQPKHSLPISNVVRLVLFV